jgi:hypothetical protein
MAGDRLNALKIVYDDLGARLAADLKNSWQIVTVAGVSLTVLAAVAGTQGSHRLWEILFGLIAAALLVLCVLYGIVSALAFRELKLILWWPNLPGKQKSKARSDRPSMRSRVLLGGPERRVWEHLRLFLDPEKDLNSFFHTHAFVARLGRAVTAGGSTSLTAARVDYLNDIGEAGSADRDLAEYLFFLALLIEIRRFPRTASALCLAFGMLAVLIFMMFRLAPA